jgi:3-phenylpropionate/cinnamic acid dioxygenase small subunit
LHHPRRYGLQTVSCGEFTWKRYDSVDPLNPLTLRASRHLPMWSAPLLLIAALRRSTDLPAMNMEHIFRVCELNARYVDAIDADRLEAWPDFFLDDGRYRITTAENAALGLPLSLIYATSRAMLRDRVKALREANIYEGQRYRHVLGPPLVAGLENGCLLARTNFMVARVMRSGDTMLFATGRYEDRVVLDASQARFAEKAVVIDSRQVDTLLAIPL